MSGETADFGAGAGAVFVGGSRTLFSAQILFPGMAGCFPAKALSSAVHKSLRRRAEGVALFVVEHTLTAIERDGQGMAVATNLVNRLLCAILEDVLLFVLKQPRFIEPLFADMRSLVLASGDITRKGGDAWRVPVRRILANLHRLVEWRGRYLSMARMLVNAEAVPGETHAQLQQDACAVMSARLENARMHDVKFREKKIAAGVMDEMRALRTNLAQVLAVPRVAQNNEVRRLASMLAPVATHFASPVPADSLEYDAKASIAATPLKAGIIAEFGIMDKHVGGSSEEWLERGCVVATADRNPPFLGVPYLVLHRMYVQAERRKEGERGSRKQPRDPDAPGTRVKRVAMALHNVPARPAALESVSSLYSFDAEKSWATGFKRPSAVLRNAKGEWVHVKSKEDPKSVDKTIDFWELGRKLGVEVPRHARAVWVQHDMSLWQQVIAHAKTERTVFMHDRWALSEGGAVLVLESEYLESKMMQKVTDEEYQLGLPDVGSLVVIMLENKYMGGGDLNKRNIFVTGKVDEQGVLRKARSFVRCDCAFVSEEEICEKFNARGLQTSMHMKFPPTLDAALRLFIAQHHARIAGWCEELLCKHANMRHPAVRYRLFDDAKARAALLAGSPSALDAFVDDVFQSPSSRAKTLLVPGQD